MATNGLVRFKDDGGQEVGFTKDDVRSLLCQNATDQELLLFTSFCQSHRLDPIGSKDAYLIKYGQSAASIITNYQVFNRRAYQDDNYGGIESGVVVLTAEGKMLHRHGSAVYKALNEALLGGWARVHFKDGKEPAFSELALEDFDTGKSNWTKMPGVMIEKCAKATAWRTAYPDYFGGMYISEEMGERGEAASHAPQPVQAKVETTGAAVHAVDLSPVRERFTAWRTAMGLDPQQGASNLAAAVDAESMQTMTAEQVAKAVELMDRAIAKPADSPTDVDAETGEVVQPELYPEEVEF